MSEVVLTAEELLVAATIGIKRRIDSVCAGMKNNHGYDGSDAWTVDIEGAAAEVVVAKLLNRYWQAGVGTFKAGDVGSKIQVRMTLRPDGRLIVRSDDADEAIFVLVRGRAPCYEVVGWIRAGDAKRPEYLRDYNKREPAYFVPAEGLTAFSRRAG